MPRVELTKAAQTQFRAYLGSDDRSWALNRLYAMANNPLLSAALVSSGSGTNIRRAKIRGFHFYLLPAEKTATVHDAVLWVLKVRP